MQTKCVCVLTAKEDLSSTWDSSLCDDVQALFKEMKSESCSHKGIHYLKYISALKSKSEVKEQHNGLLKTRHHC